MDSYAIDIDHTPSRANGKGFWLYPMEGNKIEKRCIYTSSLNEKNWPVDHINVSAWKVPVTHVATRGTILDLEEWVVENLELVEILLRNAGRDDIDFNAALRRVD